MPTTQPTIPAQTTTDRRSIYEAMADRWDRYGAAYASLTAGPGRAQLALDILDGGAA